MKAVLLKEFGSPLSVENVPDPALGTGEVIVDVAAAGVPVHMGAILSGERDNYLLDLPVVPGGLAVGRVRALGPDATRLSLGDWVWCDPTVRSRDDVRSPDIYLQGGTANGESALPLMRYFGNGSYAEQLLIPTENAYPIGPIDPADVGKWVAVNNCATPYGGLLAADLKAGETILISGATGNYGSAAVSLAIAMGAGCVVAPGRNQKVLTELERRFGSRVRTVELSGQEDEDRERMRRAAPGPIDVVFDMLSPSAPATAVRTAIMTVRPGGRVILMGGVGSLGGEDLSLPYWNWFVTNNITVRGQLMYPREANVGLIALTRSGLFDLDQFDISEFALDDIDKAIDHAAAEGGPFKFTVVKPSPRQSQ
ncbi:zinc-binding dehydrogenase [Nocardia sp. CDC159]|uniref:Zinc-binding dehydrogenase n=1 Tax=Nocardia pulmonis TaxID=2951408 RepID=A0A9X2E235_9NOCA|nr:MULTISPECIES: zinc-binding dehydrogenase [Nocardia]MCM6772459.1 zinc-binding dehydrogenase [Nocardia pulmonis]MCM6784883.1 zinc-binding dehydrogenase [Nocardia sp. CDC159]